MASEFGVGALLIVRQTTGAVPGKRNGNDCNGMEGSSSASLEHVKGVNTLFLWNQFSLLASSSKSNDQTTFAMTSRISAYARFYLCELVDLPLPLRRKVLASTYLAKTVARSKAKRLMAATLIICVCRIAHPPLRHKAFRVLEIPLRVIVAAHNFAAGWNLALKASRDRYGVLRLMASRVISIKYVHPDNNVAVVSDPAVMKIEQLESISRFDRDCPFSPLCLRISPMKSGRSTSRSRLLTAQVLDCWKVLHNVEEANRLDAFEKQIDIGVSPQVLQTSKRFAEEQISDDVECEPLIGVLVQQTLLLSQSLLAESMTERLAGSAVVRIVRYNYRRRSIDGGRIPNRRVTCSRFGQSSPQVDAGYYLPNEKQQRLGSLTKVPTRPRDLEKAKCPMLYKTDWQGW
ncbi:hypothetical protein KC360_g215 [Hortaea werneckii]|nr:hypothetical protein KC344_g219 [Hortaea werneckii]KAI7180414.1 hypothetical protein KC360_g215 [Hortaea werneckii]